MEVAEGYKRHKVDYYYAFLQERKRRRVQKLLKIADNNHRHLRKGYLRKLVENLKIRRV